MNYKLFLDDIRMPVHAYNYTGWVELKENSNWIIVRSFDEFTKYISEHGMPEIISFDHDLADEHYAPVELWNNSFLSNESQISAYHDWAEKQKFLEKTGYHCARWLVEYCMDNKLILPNYFSHSMNPSGKEKILSILDQYKEHEKNVKI